MGEVERTRREQYSDATRQALIDGARRLFVDRGYSRTSTEDLARAAQVTKGALYHHFEGKQSLFEAVMDDLESEFQARVFASYERAADAWAGALHALDVFLDECADTDYGRIVFVEGPVALGWPRWRECEEKYGYRLTEALVSALMDAGLVERAPLAATTWAVFGMLGHVGLALAEAPDSQRAELKTDFRTVLRRLLEGLRPQKPAPPRRRRRS